MTDDPTNPDFVLGAVLAQLEDLTPAQALEVLKQALDLRANSFPPGAEVEVQFSCEVFVRVDLHTGLPTRTVVQTPNVATMDEVLTHCQRYGPDVEAMLHHPARWGREATEAERARTIQILDDNNWPAPELVS